MCSPDQMSFEMHLSCEYPVFSMLPTVLKSARLNCTLLSPQHVPRLFTLAKRRGLTKNGLYAVYIKPRGLAIRYIRPVVMITQAAEMMMPGLSMSYIL